MFTSVKEKVTEFWDSNSRRRVGKRWVDLSYQAFYSSTLLNVVILMHLATNHLLNNTVENPVFPRPVIEYLSSGLFVIQMITAFTVGRDIGIRRRARSKISEDVSDDVLNSVAPD